MCTICGNKDLEPKLCTIKKHKKTRDHQNRVRSSSFTMPIQCAGVKAIPKVTERMKYAELEITASICCHGALMGHSWGNHGAIMGQSWGNHGAIMAVDHLGEVCSAFIYTTELYKRQE